MIKRAQISDFNGLIAQWSLNYIVAVTCCILILSKNVKLNVQTSAERRTKTKTKN